jgi:osmotically-inducible protein OsmY
MKYCKFTNAAALLIVMFTLEACAPLMVGGMVSGAMVASDRRTSGIQLEDEGIELKSANRIREMMNKDVHVNVTSYNRQVLLTGEVPAEKDKQYAASLVSQVENVKGVVNELVISPVSSLGDRSSDSYISAKLKAQMIDSKDIFASAYKVITERGVVYLMGRVTQRESDRATEIARQVNGVKKVVRLFEILTEEQLKQLVPEPPKN